MADFTLSVKVTGNSKEFTDAMEKAKQSSKGFDDQQKKTNFQIKQSESKFMGLASKIKAAAASYGILKTAMSGITYNATMEQYETSFEVMTGSAEKAADTVAELQKIAAETPFEMPQIANTTQLLMNYGFTADEAISRMEMLGDISQGSADKMSRIATAYGQMSSAGKVQLEDIKQMIEAGFNPLQEISKTTGESMESLYDRISDGTLSVDEITESMKRSTSEGGKYFQSMDKQSQNLSGRFSTLKDTVSMALGDALKPFTDWLRDSAIPFATEFFKNIDSYLPIIGALVTVFGAAKTAIFLYNIQQAAATAGLTLWQAITTLATGATAGLKAALTALTSPIGLVTLAIGAIIAIGMLLITHWEEVKEIAGQVWGWIKAKFEAFSNWLKDVFTKDWSEAFGFLGDLLNGVLATVKNIWGGVKQTFSGIIDFITGVFTGNWKKAWNGVKNIFSGVFNSFRGIVKAPLNAVIGLINAAISGLNRISVTIPDWVPIWGGNHYGINLPKIPYLARGTDDFAGGLAYINESGRGELVNLPNGTQVIPHDISARYARETARANSGMMIDLEGILEGVVINVYSQTNVDGTPLYEKAADFTVKKITNQQRNSMRSKGVFA